MDAKDSPSIAPTAPHSIRPAVGRRLRWLMRVVFGLVAVVGANSAYLAGVTFLEWRTGQPHQEWFYLLMFGAHLVLGLLLVGPFLVFALAHLRNTHHRPNRAAVRVGYMLLAFSLAALISGVLLMRVGGFYLKDPAVRPVLYWAHVLAPLLAVWGYVLHRLAGPRLRWRAGLSWAGATGLLTAGLMASHHLHPRVGRHNAAAGAELFEPSPVRTAHARLIPARTLMMDDYCQKCHPDGYEGWFHSAHHFSSFNNPAYLFSVRETRAVVQARDGTMQASRWCAGCHDPVPLLTGRFDNPNLETDPTGQAGITCTACHSITALSGSTGNGGYLVEEPLHYPFAYSTNAVLQFINQTLVKSRPAFHKQTFLKPLHKTAEFCAACHKVSLPYAVNHYKEWLRGQNSYDSFLVSGVSGHGARSFYYPDRAQPNCAGCHMPLRPSLDFGAKRFDSTNPAPTIHHHLFAGGNAALPFLRGETNLLQEHERFLRGALRVDLFGLKEGGTVDSPLLAPVRPRLPILRRNHTYLVELVVRNLRVGHQFTQGTSDSNEIWLDALATSGGRQIGRSGGLDAFRAVDPWAHFINTFMLDKQGRRIDRRNAQDIFTPLYNHQLNPGSAQVVHYRLTVPETAADTLTLTVKLQYRKFDTRYVSLFLGPDRTNPTPSQTGTVCTNPLPILTIASDTVTFPVGAASEPSGPHAAPSALPAPPPEWQRWNDYGIGLLLEGDRGSEKGELVQAEEAFRRVEGLGRVDGPLNLARVYFKEGRLEEAVGALRRAEENGRFASPANRWTVAWLNGLVDKQNGFLDQAMAEFRSILEDRSPELEARGFDFSQDYEVINELGLTLFERAKQERSHVAPRRDFLEQAATRFAQTLALDAENLTAHYNLALIAAELGDTQRAATHRRLHEQYRPDDNARDHAISTARRQNPPADHAAQAIVIYDLHRPSSLALEANSVGEEKRNLAEAGH